MGSERRIVGLNRGIKWWDVHLGREVLYLPTAETPPRRLALSPDGRRIAADVNRKLVLWEAGPP
jgi:hypothetical protein